MKDFHLSDEEIAELRVAHRHCGDKRAAYRLNAVILLGSGWSAKEVSEALLIDEGTLRGYVKRYQKGGAERLLKTEYRGGLSYLSDPQKRELEAHLRSVRTRICAPGTSSVP